WRWCLRGGRWLVVAIVGPPRLPDPPPRSSAGLSVVVSHVAYRTGFRRSKLAGSLVNSGRSESEEAGQVCDAPHPVTVVMDVERIHQPRPGEPRPQRPGDIVVRGIPDVPGVARLDAE